MTRKQQIGWQKYEDVLEKQLSSPITQMLVNQMIAGAEEEEEEDESYEDSIRDVSQTPLIQISEDLANEFTMAASFDCWVGHTNFDITPKVKNILNSVEGVEVLKICSRYRFFIGVGKMFKFKDVRKEVETQVFNKE
jgi:hypothetical protein